MSNEERFKKSVENLLNEPHFAYDAGNWEKVNNALDKGDKRKKRLIWVSFAGLRFALGVLCSYFFIGPDRNDVNIAQTPAGQSAIITKPETMKAPQAGLEQAEPLQWAKIVEHLPGSRIQASGKQSDAKPIIPEKNKSFIPGTRATPVVVETQTRFITDQVEQPAAVNSTPADNNITELPAD